MLAPKFQDFGSPKQRPWRTRTIVINGLLAFFATLAFYRYLHPGGLGFGGLGGLGCLGLANHPETPPSPMDVFQVYPPVRVGQDFLPALESTRPECSVVLMQHVFGWSYGKPFVGTYAPPECEWTHVLFNLTMSSAGRQFDRLAMMFVGDVEVFRTSTAEPTWYGIEFNYVKDMTAFSSLLRAEQKIIFDLGNLVDDTYTGSFNATLVATFYTPSASVSVGLSGPADAVFAISQRKSAENQPSYFRLPQDRALTSVSLPPNTIRATVSISASGNADEEFWYTNVPDNFTDTFGANTLPGHSPFREIQLLADGVLLGVAWPFATIFTGGINPALWRPIVGIAAFDIPEYTIDITPFLPALLPHCTFELKIVAWDSPIASDWLVSARVFAWTDPDPNWTTTGTIHAVSAPLPIFALAATLETDTAATRNTSLTLHITAQRALSATATINTSSGPRSVSWTQGLSYTHTNTLSSNGTLQTLHTLTRGGAAAPGTRSHTFSWPLAVTTDFDVAPDGAFTIRAWIDRGVETAGALGALQTRMNGSAVYQRSHDGTGTASGATTQEMAFLGVPRDTEGVGSYRRSVSARGGRLLGDEEVVNGKAVAKILDGGKWEEEGEEMGLWQSGRRSVRSILGRGPR